MDVVQGQQSSLYPPMCNGYKWTCDGEGNKTISISKVCDGISDCAEGSDEQQCGMWGFIEAARNGNHTYVREAIQQGFDVNTPDWKGWTLLFHASEAGQLSVVEELITLDADVNHAVYADCHYTYRGTNALHLALKNKHEDVAIKLLDAGANYTLTYASGKPTTVLAVANNQIEFMKQLIDSVGSSDKPLPCWDCLRVAVMKGNLEMVNLLLELPDILQQEERGGPPGAFIIAVQSSYDNKGPYDKIAKALHQAGLKLGDPDASGYGANKVMDRYLYKTALRGDLSMVKVMLEAGASVNRVRGSKYECKKKCEEFGALEAAVRGERWHIAEVLLKSGDVGQPGIRQHHRGPDGSLIKRKEQRWKNEKSLSLIIAYIAGKESYNKTIYHLLLDYHNNNTDPDLKMDLRYTYGTTEVRKHMSILHYAIESGQLAEIEQLVDAGAPLNQEPLSPLTIAVKSGKESIVKYLLSKGASPGHYELQGMDFPLSAAVAIDNDIIFDDLMIAGASSYATLKYKGESPLFRAIREGPKTSSLLYKVEKLIDIMGEMDYSEVFEEYPEEIGENLNILDMAAQRGHIPILKLLITKLFQYRRDYDKVKDYKSALLRAIQYNQATAVEILLKELNDVFYDGGNTAIQFDDQRKNDEIKQFKTEALIGAAKTGGWKIINLLYQDSNEDIINTALPVSDDGDGKYMSPLMHAVANGNKAVVDYLLHHGVTVHSTKSDGTKNDYTALHIAIQNNDKNMVYSLMGSCPDIHHLYKGKTYMEMATLDMREYILSKYEAKGCADKDKEYLYYY